MARRLRGEHRPYFSLHGYTVVIDKRDGDAAPRCEATVRLEVAGTATHTAADGDGPSTPSTARCARRSPASTRRSRTCALTDYKVRVLAGPATGTASVVRVHIETTDGRTSWGTVGAHSNLIDASYEALLDAIESKLLGGRASSPPRWATPWRRSPSAWGSTGAHSHPRPMRCRKPPRAFGATVPTSMISARACPGAASARSRR